MAEAYADLKLYFGIVSADGCREGRFDVSKLDNEYFQRRFNKAMDTVTMYLQPAFHFGFRIGSNPFVSTREEADFLIAYCVANVEGANPVISLYDCIHGKIRFHQLLRFNGWIREREKELIEKIKGPGFKPKFYKREELEMHLRVDPNSKYLIKRFQDAEEEKWKESLSWVINNSLNNLDTN
ncbi:hypothetical protein J4466_03375 [Candidatus Pacearchaeota archaeon]|nr:hypothetical protein [Candidatus Pacearchaeota archaeon]